MRTTGAFQFSRDVPGFYERIFNFHVINLEEIFAQLVEQQDMEARAEEIARVIHA